jgi:hypothetical protein
MIDKIYGSHQKTKTVVGVSTPGGPLDRRVNCRCVSQPRWVSARWNTRGKKGGTATRVILRPGRMRLQ